MPTVRIVIALGAIDGVNTVFATGTPYVPGSTAYILNGRVHNLHLAHGANNDYGYVELDPDAGTIQVDNPPELDDVVQIFFQDRIVVPAPAIDRIAAVLRTERLQGVVREPNPERLVGIIRKC